jgi:hypothetical protein
MLVIKLLESVYERIWEWRGSRLFLDQDPVFFKYGSGSNPSFYVQTLKPSQLRKFQLCTVCYFKINAIRYLFHRVHPALHDFRMFYTFYGHFGLSGSGSATPVEILIKLMKERCYPLSKVLEGPLYSSVIPQA